MYQTPPSPPESDGDDSNHDYNNNNSNNHGIMTLSPLAADHSTSFQGISDSAQTTEKEETIVGSIQQQQQQQNHLQSSPSSSSSGSNNKTRQIITFILGTLIILVVVLIWVGSSEAIQFIFRDMQYDQPFLLTYTNTGLFTVYLVGFLLNSRWRMMLRLFLKKWKGGKMRNATERKLAHTMRKTLWTALTLCPLWIMANITFNFSLALTSVSSNTIISNTSSLFCFVLGFLLGIDLFSFSRLLSIAFTLSGIILIALSDQKEGRDSLIGNALSLISAFMYGVYTTWIKLMVPNEREISMPMLFGLVGLANLFMWWPLFFLFHQTGLEKFRLPPNAWVVLALIGQGLIGTVLSDLFWASSVVLTTPVISTLGLSLTIPLAVWLDIFMQKKTFRWQFMLGGGLVGVGFLLANLSYQYPRVLKRLDSPGFCEVLNFGRVLRRKWKRLSRRFSVSDEQASREDLEGLISDQQGQLQSSSSAEGLDERLSTV